MAGIAEWVCCPGIRNDVALSALSCCPVIHRWAHVDDRAAAYFALGRCQATARPVALLAGSGSSAAAMMPAVVEAYYQRRPLLVVTVETPEDSGGTGSPGHVELEGFFGIFAPTVALDLPGAVSDLPDLRAMLGEGFPVHLCVRIGEGVQTVGDYSDVVVADPPAAPRFRGSLVALSQMLRFRAQEGLVLILGALDPLEQEPALWLAQTLRVPVLAEASSGLREELAPYLLRGGEEWLASCPPRYVLRVGEVPTGAFWQALEELPEVEVFSVTRTGFSGLTRRSTVIEGELEQIMKALGDVPHLGDASHLLKRSRQEAARMEEVLLTNPESEAALVRALSNEVCVADVLTLGSPTSLALWNRYAQLQAPTVYLRANTASSGADGALSSFLGNAVGASYAACLVGDISLLRDVNAAAVLPQLPPGKRVVAVLSNQGAAQALEPGMDPERYGLALQAPGLEVAEVARLWGAEYYAIRCEADFEVLESLDGQALVMLELLGD